MTITDAVRNVVGLPNSPLLVTRRKVCQPEGTEESQP